MPISFPVRRVSAFGLVLLSIGCGGGGQGPGSATPNTEQTLSELFNLSAVYQRIGRIAAGGPMPFVGAVGFVAGAGDSTIARVGLSLENHAFAFQRDAGSFSTRFRVEYAFQRSGAEPVTATRDEIIRVRSFQETQRSDESVIVEQGFLLAPGSYNLSITVRDPASNVFSRAEKSIEVPAFTPGSITPPILVYEARPRATTADSLTLLLNPRGTVATGGGDSLLMYVEGYRFSGPATVPIEVRDDRDSVVYRSQIAFTGGKGVEAHLVPVGSASPPLGELRIAVGSGPSAQRVSALVSFSRNWVVTSYENLLGLMRYFIWAPDRLAALRNAKADDRPRLWREFWTATDPIPATPENEALDQYFIRIAIANERFRDEGGPGWRTDRGEVFITLGEPDQVLETPPSSDRRRVQWIYSNYRAAILFEGTIGFSRLRMSPSSRSEFSRARTQAMRNGPVH
jgi:GWxTD domain-containing protein